MGVVSSLATREQKLRNVVRFCRRFMAQTEKDISWKINVPAVFQVVQTKNWGCDATAHSYVKFK